MITNNFFLKNCFFFLKKVDLVKINCFKRERIQNDTKSKTKSYF